MLNSDSYSLSGTMAINICIYNDKNRFIKELGFIEDKDIENIKKWDTQGFIKCLKMIDPCGDTTFNHKQVQYIEHELGVIKNISIINLNILTVLTEAVDTILNDTEHKYYLKFIGD